MRTLRDLFILLLIFGGVWAFFSYFPIVPDKDFFQIPLEKEKQIGDLIFEYQLEENPEFHIVEDPFLDSVVSVISNRLIAEIDEPLFNYEFYVVSSEQVNAFTIPGGRIFIYTGLLTTAENAEEVASVLAHELGHAEERHVMNKLAKEIGLSVILSDDGFVLGQISKTLGSSKFDRIQEKKADDFGLQLMEESGIDPRHFGSFMMKMRELEQLDSELFELVSTHPASEKRSKRALNYPLDEDFEEIPFDISWEQVNEAIAALPSF